MDIQRRGMVLGSLALTLMACGGGGGGGAAAISERTVYVNPDDSAVYKLDADNGEQVTFFGQRDADGLPTAITHLSYQDAQGQAFEIGVDEFGLPVRGADESGNVIRLTYLDAEGQAIQKSLKADAADATRSVSSIGIDIISNDDDEARSIGGVLSLDSPVIVDLDEALAQLQAAEPVGNVTVDVAKCDTPVDPSGGVVVNFASLSVASSGRYPAWPTGQTGRYVARVPVRQPIDVPDQLEAVCTGFSGLLNQACLVFNPAASPAGSQLVGDPTFQAGFCAQVAVLASATPAAPITGSAAGALCLATLAGGTFACNTLGQSFSASPDTPSILDRLCDVEGALNAVDSAVGLDQVSLQAIADFQAGASISAPGSQPRGIVASEQRSANAAGPFPTLAINDLRPSVDRFVTSPATPQLNQAYTASATLSCVQDADIALTAERGGGTVAAHAVTSSSNRRSISVQVAAATQADTVDVLTVSASNMATAQSVTQKRSVVFEGEPDTQPAPGDFDFSAVNRARFTLSVNAQGMFYPDASGADAFTQVRAVNDDHSYPGFGSVPCPRQNLGSEQNNQAFGFAFSNQNGGGESQGAIVVQVDPQTCKTAHAMQVTHRDGDDREITMQLLDVSVEADIISAQRIRYRLSGSGLCEVVSNFDLFENDSDGDFEADVPLCNASSALSIELLH